MDIQNSTLYPPPKESSSLRVVKVKTIVVKMENRGNLYHWPTTVWLRSSSLCSCENEARPHTETELQHFKKKKNTNGKSQMGFQIGGGRQWRNLLAQFLKGLNSESEALTCNHELAFPFFCGCRTGNVHSTAHCTSPISLSGNAFLEPFIPIPTFCKWILSFMKIKMRAKWTIFFHKTISASEWIN